MKQAEIPEQMQTEGMVEGVISRIRSKISKFSDWLTKDWTFNSWKNDKSWNCKEDQLLNKWKFKPWRLDDKDKNKRKAA